MTPPKTKAAPRLAPDEAAEPRRAPAAPNYQAPPSTIVIFGATGDLTHRKLGPALWNLFREGYLHPETRIVAFARRDYTDESIAEELRGAIEKHSRVVPSRHPELWDEFARLIGYHQGQLDEEEPYHSLRTKLEGLESAFSKPPNRLYYLAISPEYFLPAVRNLGSAGLAVATDPHRRFRLIVEKPFGRDLESSRRLNRHLLNVFDERQVYRIDHYLGKETVQNIFSFRFGNAIFEPLFNRHYVDHVQITVAETLGMEGRRGQYFDTAGTLRDMVQNHLMQLLSLVAMEPPTAMNASAFHKEKVKVLDSLRPFVGTDLEENAVRGQYGGAPGVKAYREETGVAPDSRTETFVALRLAIDNWRWAGVPFVVRSGKRLACKTTEIAIEFRQPPMRFFSRSEGDRCDISLAKPNVLVFRIQPQEGLSLSFASKKAGMEMTLQNEWMDFMKDEAERDEIPEAYERLLLDALRGDNMLFTRSDEVEKSWEFFTPLLEHWSENEPKEFPNYAAGTWGPEKARRLLKGCAGSWRNPKSDAALP